MDEATRKAVHPYGCFDAQEWAKTFYERFGGDEALMQGWFANAIMTGYDKAKNEDAREVRELRQALLIAMNTVECSSIDYLGRDLPWYANAKRLVGTVKEPLHEALEL